MRFEYFERNDFERKNGGLVTQNIILPKYKIQIIDSKLKCRPSQIDILVCRTTRKNPALQCGVFMSG